MDYIEREEGEEVREIPILFSTEMVQAILDGRKTMTRRVVKAPVLYKVVAPPSLISQVGDVWEFLWNGKMVGGGFKIKPPYTVGDHLWVRETWAYIDRGFGGDAGGYVYRASENGQLWETETEGWRWRPSIHMPKEAARIWLEVTNVRVERLQEITEEDAKAEGVMPIYGNDFASEKRHYPSFARLWDNRYAKRGHGWETNPWVWVIEFKKVTPCD